LTLVRGSSVGQDTNSNVTRRDARRRLAEGQKIPSNLTVAELVATLRRGDNALLRAESGDDLRRTLFLALTVGSVLVLLALLTTRAAQGGILGGTGLPPLPGWPLIQRLLGQVQGQGGLDRPPPSGGGSGGTTPSGGGNGTSGSGGITSGGGDVTSGHGTSGSEGVTRGSGDVTSGSVGIASGGGGGTSGSGLGTIGSGGVTSGGGGGSGAAGGTRGAAGGTSGAAGATNGAAGGTNGAAGGTNGGGDGASGSGGSVSSTIPGSASGPQASAPQTTWTAPTSLPMSDRPAAALVVHQSETRPDNAQANDYVPSDSELAAFRTSTNQYGQTPDQYNPLARYITGRPGLTNPSTDDLIQWAAHKWGIPEAWISAAMVVESSWRQSMLGDSATVSSGAYWQYPRPARAGNDQAYRSMGVMQVQWSPDGSVHPGTEPLRWKSTAFNLDVYASDIRYFYGGYCKWCGPGYSAGQQWSSIGAWYEPNPWNNPGAEKYIQQVQDALSNGAWAQPGF
jgi:hypothetical protein